jgi:RNA polymerase sigma-70 factor (ECF subfamily)
MLLTSEPRSNEAALVRAAQAGNRAAFGELYARYSRMIHGILLAHAQYADAEDLMQDVFVRAMEQLSALRESAAFGGWLASIARRAAFDHHRRMKAVAEMPGDLASPDRADAEAFETLALIQELPEAYRETLVLRLVEGMTGPEIAERTGLTHSSVRVNLCRGMKILRERLEGKR